MTNEPNTVVAKDTRIARRAAIAALAAGVAAGMSWAFPRIADAANTQAGWRWCNKCAGMFYAKASAGLGHCPAGGAHTATGSGKYLAVLGATAAGQQGGWRWCNKCEGMFYAKASAGMGHCPAGGAHSASGSGTYATLLGETGPGPGGAHQQGGWRWCSKCEGMFYAKASSGMGHCPAGGAHVDAGSGHYAFLLT